MNPTMYRDLLLEETKPGGRYTQQCAGSLRIGDSFCIMGAITDLWSRIEGLGKWDFPRAFGCADLFMVNGGTYSHNAPVEALRAFGIPESSECLLMEANDGVGPGTKYEVLNRTLHELAQAISKLPLPTPELPFKVGASPGERPLAAEPHEALSSALSPA